MPITINIPGSKSISNRALLLAGLAKGTSTIKNLALCDDTYYMIEGLKKLGVQISLNGTTAKIKGNEGNFKHQSKPIKIFTGNAGTSTRFLSALATITGNEITINGDTRMSERPINELTTALNRLGADAKTKQGCPPVSIGNKKIEGGKINIRGNISSQYISAILMIAAFAKKTTQINIVQKLCSKPYLEMTIRIMDRFKIKVLNKKFKQLTIKPQRSIAVKNFTVESDASSASYIAAYAALHPEKKILMKNIFTDSIQGDIEFIKYLKKMGCKFTKDKSGTKVQGPKILKALGTVDMNKTPDLVMTFAVLAGFTKGKTRITNIENLRIKETDRIKALENELKKIGAKVKTGKNYIEIHSSKLTFDKKVEIKTYNDHRIAMCFGVVRDFFTRLKIENPNCVSKSYTTFWEDLKKLES